MLKDNATIYLRKVDGKVTKALLNIPISIVNDSAFPRNTSGKVVVELKANKLIVTFKEENE